MAWRKKSKRKGARSRSKSMSARDQEDVIVLSGPLHLRGLSAADEEEAHSRGESVLSPKGSLAPRPVLRKKKSSPSTFTLRRRSSLSPPDGKDKLPPAGEALRMHFLPVKVVYPESGHPFDRCVTRRERRQVERPQLKRLGGLLARDFDLVHAVLNSSLSMELNERFWLAAAVLEVLKLHARLEPFLEYVIRAETRATRDVNTLFRGLTVATCVARAALHDFPALDYLELVITRFNESLEALDATEDDVPALCDVFLNKLKASINELPVVAQACLRIVYQVVSEEAPGQAFQAVASFYFLRFLLPALSANVSKHTPGRKGVIIKATKWLQMMGSGVTPKDCDADTALWFEVHLEMMNPLFLDVINRPHADQAQGLLQLAYPNEDTERLRRVLFSYIIKHGDTLPVPQYADLKTLAKEPL